MLTKKQRPLSLLLSGAFLMLLGSCLEAGPNRLGDHASRESGTSFPTEQKQAAAIAHAPLLPDMLAYRNISEVDAEKLNANIPLVAGPITAARAFTLDSSVTAAARAAAVDCLTAAIYYEAASESESGQRAVAQVVLNRLRDPAFPKTICDVVFQGAERDSGCQFTFSCDGSLSRTPSAAAWTRARRYAEQALAGYVEKTVGIATHYHTRQVVPVWRLNLDKIAVEGAHIFYRIPGRRPGTGPAGLARSAAISPIAPTLIAHLSTPYLLSASQPAPPSIGDMGQETAPSPQGTAVRPVQIALAADEHRPVLRADQERGILLAPSARLLP